MGTIVETFCARHGKSRGLYQEALKSLPDGVTHDTRFARPFPIYVTHGAGPRKWDVDGNEYIDYVMGHGALLLGHSHPKIVGAVTRQMARATHLGACSEEEVAWAKAVKRLVPSIERIRFHSSGTEATLMALRLARAFTGKPKILKFVNHFHGWHDYLIAEAGKYASAGIPEQTSQTVLRIPAGDIAEVENVLSRDREIAGVILEPTGASMGYYPLTAEFLRGLREVTARHGVVLIFDEVVTGFRAAPGGAQERYGVKPDLTTLGKILAGGLPGGAVGGRAEILDMISHREDARWNVTSRVSHPGTFNANPLSAAAGVTCLTAVAEEPLNEAADRAAAHLVKGLNEVMGSQKVVGFAHGLASVAWVVFGTRLEGDPDRCTVPHAKLREALAAPALTALKQAMQNEGVDIMGTNEFIVSATHGDREIDQTIGAFDRSVAALKRDGLVRGDA